MIPATCRTHQRTARTGSRSEKGNILSQVFGDSKKLFTKQSPEPVSSPNNVPSIEAWLESTPDPFVDVQEEANNTIQPAKHATAPENRTKEQRLIVEDTNRIWDELDTKEGTRRAISGSKKKKRVRGSAVYKDNPFPISLRFFTYAVGRRRFFNPH